MYNLNEKRKAIQVARRDRAQLASAAATESRMGDERG